MTEFYQNLFHYTHYANKKVISILQEHAVEDTPQAMVLMNHLINAHQLWNNRVSPHEESFGVWQIHPRHQLHLLDQVNYERSLELLSVIVLEKEITYTNTFGDTYTRTVGKIFYHIINHSNYHRGQIALRLREMGIDPPVTDYIYFEG